MKQLKKIMAVSYLNTEPFENISVYTIDTLDMLKEKTMGNLDEDESRLLEQTISDLRLSLDSEKGKTNQTSAKGKGK